MFLGPYKYAIALIVAVIAIVGSYTSGYWKGYRAGWTASETKWIALKHEWEAAAAARERELRAKGDTLAAELEAAKSKVRVETVEVVRTVYKKASATRACFSPDITEILNRSTPIRETVERPGAAPKVIDHRSEAPVGGTSELAAAEWVANARAAHEECRAQVGKLGDWIRALTSRKAS